MEKYFTCLRHPEYLQRGISLMKATHDKDYKKVLDIAWKRFNINFNLNIVNTVPEGIEAFGFGTQSNDFHTEEQLLNNLQKLRDFTKTFKSNNETLLRLVENYQVDLPSQFSQRYFERPTSLMIPFDKETFFNLTDFKEILSLTQQEQNILRLVASGYPADYIAARLHLSKKTVENYLSSIKIRLGCSSKIELIQKAQRIEATGYFD
jgi:DNA-binding CsgD family transcriptional regulator